MARTTTTDRTPMSHWWPTSLCVVFIICLAVGGGLLARGLEVYGDESVQVIGYYAGTALLSIGGLLMIAFWVVFFIWRKQRRRFRAVALSTDPNGIHRRPQSMNPVATPSPLWGQEMELTSFQPVAESLKFTNSHENVEVNPTLKGRLTGWRRLLLLASLAGILVFFFNLGFTLYAVQHHHLQNDQGVLYDGDCQTARNGNIGFHLVINILSTALLGASSYCMQCLCAPTRKDIDQAHGQGKWLDIGVASFRNLFQVSKKKTYLWMGLAFSSVPLHLLYNSTIFSTTSANAYIVFIGSGALGQSNPDDLNLNIPGTFNRITVNVNLTQGESYLKSIGFADEIPTLQAFATLYEKAQNGTLARLDNAACVDAYATPYQSNYGNLLVVTDDSVSPNTYNIVAQQEVFDSASEATVGSSPYRWLCADLDKPSDGSNGITPCLTYMPQVRAEVANNNWTVGGSPVSYCLSEVIPQRCKIQYNLSLTVTVLVFNLAKVIIMGYIAFMAAGTPILTIGDAVASFMRVPDPFSQGRCLISMEEVREPLKHYNKVITFDNRPKRWRSAISRRRWSTGIVLHATAISICVILLGLGLALPFDRTNIWSIGLGQVATQTMLSSERYWISSVAFNAFLANLPQLIFSMLYFATNGIITTMALADSYSQYAVERKSLRVTTPPIGSQRGTYYLSLPYRYAIPLLVVSTVIHWLISESLYLVQIEAYTPTLERDPDNDITTCGYSPVAIVASIAVEVVLLCCVIALSLKRFKSGMPVVGSCSFAIAAACHPNLYRRTDGGRNQESESESLPLQWGVVQPEGEVGHCAFSSLEVAMPDDGRVYQ